MKNGRRFHFVICFEPAKIEAANLFRNCNIFLIKICLNMVQSFVLMMLTSVLTLVNNHFLFPSSSQNIEMNHENLKMVTIRMTNFV